MDAEYEALVAACAEPIFTYDLPNQRPLKTSRILFLLPRIRSLPSILLGPFSHRHACSSWLDG